MESNSTPSEFSSDEISGTMDSIVIPISTIGQSSSGKRPASIVRPKSNKKPKKTGNPKATRVREGTGESAACVPLALSHLSGEAFSYEDFRKLKLSEDGEGFTLADLEKAIKHFMPGSKFQNIRKLPNDPTVVFEKMKALVNENVLSSHKFLVFGLLKDERSKSKRKANPEPIANFWHCSAIEWLASVPANKQYWCAYYGYLPVIEGLKKFRSINAIIAFERSNKYRLE